MLLRKYIGRVFRNFATLISSQNLMDDLTSSPERQGALNALYYHEKTADRPTPVERVLEKSEDQIAQDEIDAKFRPSAWNASRYSDGSWAVIYAAESEETALREVLHHMTLFYKEELQAGPVNAQRRVLSLKVDSERCRDLDAETGLNRAAILSRDESGYPYCQNLAELSRREGVQMLRAPSARHEGGFCTPIFDKAVVAKDEGHLKYLSCILYADGTAHVTGLISEETKIYRLQP